jgi:hypothetical protein
MARLWSSQWSQFRRKVQRCQHGDACADCCWPWLGSCDAHGYGRTRYVIDGVPEHYAHRVAYALHCVRLAGTFEVCHSCDTPRCCNWHHLWLGTHADNQRDMARKGRSKHGGRPSMIAPQERWRLVEAWQGGLSQRQIAAQFGISQARVSQLLRQEP